MYRLYTTLIDENKFIPGKEEDIYRFRLSINDYETFIERDSDEFKYSLTISYRDLLDIAEYEQEYIIKLRLNKSKDYSPLLYGQPTSTKINNIFILLMLSISWVVSIIMPIIATLNIPFIDNYPIIGPKFIAGIEIIPFILLSHVFYALYIIYSFLLTHLPAIIPKR